MATMIPDPPGFERRATKGTPQDHVDQGHTVVSHHDPFRDYWECETCADCDVSRLMAATSNHRRAQLRDLAEEMRTTVATRLTQEAVNAWADRLDAMAREAR